MVDRYVFGLSTKHPVVSARDFNNEAFQPSLTRRKNAADVTQNIKFSTNLDSLISYMSSYTRCAFFERRKDGEILPKMA